MSFLQALLYFLREAVVGLVRSWRVSVLAVLTIAVSLWLAGALLLTSGNLAGALADWRREARFVVYLAEGSDAAARARVEQALRAAPWVTAVDYVSPEQGAVRFRAAFPSLAELVEDARYGSLPASFEARLRDLADDELDAHRAWTAALAALPGVETLDDDRDWIGEVETLLAVARTLGTLLTAVLLGASIFTVAAVVRLTSFLYRDEIAVLRLVGATEFYIRGPFYLEGILQGLAGALLALGTLRLLHLGLAPTIAASPVLSLVGRGFLAPREIAALLAVGAAAGLGGALASLGRERPASERA